MFLLLLGTVLEVLKNIVFPMLCHTAALILISKLLPLVYLLSIFQKKCTRAPKELKWKEAIFVEMRALHINETGEVVELP